MTSKPRRRKWDLPEKVGAVRVPLYWVGGILVASFMLFVYSETHFVLAGDFAQYQKRQDNNWYQNEVRTVQRDLRQIDDKIFHLEVKEEYKKLSPMERKLLQKYRTDRDFIRKDLMRLKAKK